MVMEKKNSLANKIDSDTKTNIKLIKQIMYLSNSKFYRRSCINNYNHWID